MNAVDQAAADQEEIDNPALCNAIEKNIRTLAQLTLRAEASRSPQDKVADAVTDFSGQLWFVYIHCLWFGIWIALNTGKFGLAPFDKYPYQLLTMVVSLEAILLSTFVLISQNRMGADAEKRAELDLHIGLLTEHELTRALRMLDEIQDKLGIENDSDQELLELESETHPEDVLLEIENIKNRMRKRTHKAVAKGGQAV